MFQRLYVWMLEKSRGPRAPHALAGISFAESSVFPIPPDVMLVPMTLAAPERWQYFARICTIASVLGAVVGYLIGALLFDTLGMKIIALYGLEDKLASFMAAYDKWGMWLVLIAGVTPVPYKLITIASGFASYNFAAFILFSILARGLRFYAVTWITQRFGAHVTYLVEKRLGLVTVILLTALVLGFVSVKYLF